MAQFFHINAKNPQQRLIKQVSGILANGGVIIYPTDSSYALGCGIGHKEALDRIRRIRRLDERHNLTLMCRDLSDIGSYARVSNPAFRLMKSLTPGPYTFILLASRDVPRRLLHPKRKTIGLRVPDNNIALAILADFNTPILSTSLILPDDDQPMTNPDEIYALTGNDVDLVIDGGNGGLQATTVIDLVNDQPLVLREGKGELPAIG